MPELTELGAHCHSAPYLETTRQASAHVVLGCDSSWLAVMHHCSASQCASPHAAPLCLRPLLHQLCSALRLPPLHHLLDTGGRQITSRKF